MEIKRYLKPSQADFIAAATSLNFVEILYSGPANTGKSYIVAGFFIGLCNDFPGTRHGVFRKNLATSLRTIWHTYQKALDAHNIQYKAIKSALNPRFVIYARDEDGVMKKSTIEFFELDKTKDHDWDKTKSLELSTAHIEEANEVEESGKGMVTTRIGRWNSNGVPALAVYTCNPAPGWVREEFRDPALEGRLKPGRAFIESSEEEIPEDYKKMLMTTLSPNEYSRYVQSNWDYNNDPAQLILYEWIKPNLIPWESRDTSRADDLGVDVARYGKDRTVFFYQQDIIGEDGSLLGLRNSDIEIFTDQSTNTTGKIIRRRLEERGIEDGRHKVDVVGLGGGVVDYLEARGLSPVAFNSSSKPDKKHRQFLYKNLRAQEYMKLRKALQKGKQKLLDHADLKKELMSIRYFVKDGKIYIESKEDIKKRLGFSPDIADALVISRFSGKMLSSYIDSVSY